MPIRRLSLFTAACGIVFAAGDDASGLVAPAPRYQPLTSRERWNLYAKKTYGPEAWARDAFVSGLRQLKNEPPEWGQGAAGYGHRFGAGFARHVVRASIEYGGGALLGEDPRYERCQCRGAFPRAGHAVKSTFLARNREGERVLAAARLTGIYGSQVIALAWYPKRYTVVGDGLRWGTLSLGFNAGFNVLREFWPDLRRSLRR